MEETHYLVVAWGGALGVVSRYALSRLVNSLVPFGAVPWGTVVVNTFGSFALSYLLFASLERLDLPQEYFLFLGAGFLGAFTTLSTFTYKFFALLEEPFLRSLIYSCLNLSFGFAAAYLGMIPGRGKLS